MFFYKMILTILKNLEDELLQEDELWSILTQIKSSTSASTGNPNSQSPEKTSKDEGMVKIFSRLLGRREDDMWTNLIEKCNSDWDLDEGFIYHLL